MYDAALYNSKLAEQSGILETLNVQDFVLATLHRSENVDYPDTLQNIVEALNTISAKAKIILPLHPRTRKRLKEFNMSFDFETIEQDNGQATVIRFGLNDPRYHAGDVLLVLSGTEVHFHGMIGRIADGSAIATDRRGSLLPATTQ